MSDPNSYYRPARFKEVTVKATQWEHYELSLKESFLRNHNFSLGWSSHTWQTLPREIQAAWMSL